MLRVFATTTDHTSIFFENILTLQINTGKHTHRFIKRMHHREVKDDKE